MNRTWGADIPAVKPARVAARHLLLGLGIALSLSAAACNRGTNQSQGQTPAQSPGQSQSQANEKRYHLSGTVVSVDKDQQRIVVNHSEIPGFMGAMTMPYPIADPQTLDRVSPGDEITADVVVTDTSIHLDNVVVVKKGSGAKPGPSGANQQLSAPGDQVPDFALVNQDGKRVHLEQYRGKAILLTFIYTRCPLPDYCPLVTHNFAQIEKDLAKTPDVYAKTHLLSISFDPQYDTPAVLRTYARPFVSPQDTQSQGKQPFDHWEFASILASERADIARFFNLFYSEDGGQITHSMSTAIIAPDGHVSHWYNDNGWKPADVLSDLMASSAAAAPQERSALTASHNHS